MVLHIHLISAEGAFCLCLAFFLRMCPSWKDWGQHNSDIPLGTECAFISRFYGISNSTNLENVEFALRVLSGCIWNCSGFGFANAKPYSGYLQREGCGKGTGADKAMHKILLQQPFSKTR